MKKHLKVLSMALVLVCALFVLSGCEGIHKKVAFMDYCDSIRADASTWETLNEAMEQVNKYPNGLTMMKAVIQAKIIPSLNQISVSAANRNASIADPEIAAFDKHYVTAIEKLSEGFTLMLESLDTQDMAKVKSANNAVLVAQSEMVTYVEELDKFMKKYNIEDKNGAIAGVKGMMQP